MNSNDPEQWIPLIKSTYPENITFPKSKTVVCDLHFDPKYIIDKGRSKQLVVGALLNVGYGFYANIPNIVFKCKNFV